MSCYQLTCELTQFIAGTETLSSSMRGGRMARGMVVSSDQDLNSSHVNLVLMVSDLVRMWTLSSVDDHSIRAVVVTC